MRLFLVPLLGSALGLLTVAVSYFIPVRNFYFGGSGNTIYGFPFIIRQYWSLDLIGNGSNYNPFNIILDCVFWILVVSGILMTGEIAQRRVQWTSVLAV